METESMDGKPRRFRRKLTSFLCQEMMFEYATNRLDSERRTDIEAFLANDKASKEALKSIEAGLEYTGELAKATVPDALIRRLSYSENFRTAATRTANWRNWPESLRWSISAVAVSVLVAVLITLIPWSKLPNLRAKQSKSNEIVLADIPVAETIEPGEVPADETEGSGDHETSGDEHEIPGGAQAIIAEESIREPIAPKPITPPKAVAAVPTPVIAKPKPTVAPKVAVAPKPAVIPSVPVADSATELTDDAATDVAAAAAEAEGESTLAEGESQSAATKTEKRAQGFVYRAFLNLPNVEEAAAEITTKLTELGAEKAGEVPLGWRRGKGNYFHFALPESNEEAALEMLRSYGPVRISKDPHPRVMPEGQIRFILWVEPGT